VLEVFTVDGVTTTEHTYTIREAAALSGLPASTLRYYESIGVITPVGRGESSGHRVYTEQDMNVLVGVACLAATGLSVSDMRRYAENSDLGAAAAGEQIKMLAEQADRLAVEARQIAVRQQYVKLKIEYWRAVAAGEDEQAAHIGDEARSLAERLKPAR
jgi:DNA-binding transcriptional MerR regulator